MGDPGQVTLYSIKYTVDEPLLRRYLPAYAVNVFAFAIRIILDFSSWAYIPIYNMVLNL